jgi:hypothetical protein
MCCVDRLNPQSFAAAEHPRPSTSAFEYKGDVQATGIIALAMAAIGHKQSPGVGLSGQQSVNNLTDVIPIQNLDGDDPTIHYI